jgi:hypothetical protein
VSSRVRRDVDSNATKRPSALTEGARLVPAAAGFRSGMLMRSAAGAADEIAQNKPQQRIRVNMCVVQNRILQSRMGKLPSVLVILTSACCSCFYFSLNQSGLNCVIMGVSSSVGRSRLGSVDKRR